jgi:hypothetical protein
MEARESRTTDQTHNSRDSQGIPCQQVNFRLELLKYELVADYGGCRVRIPQVKKKRENRRGISLIELPSSHIPMNPLYPKTYYKNFIIKVIFHYKLLKVSSQD